MQPVLQDQREQPEPMELLVLMELQEPPVLEGELPVLPVLPVPQDQRGLPVQEVEPQALQEVMEQPVLQDQRGQLEPMELLVLMVL